MFRQVKYQNGASTEPTTNMWGSSTKDPRVHQQKK